MVIIEGERNQRGSLSAVGHTQRLSVVEVEGAKEGKRICLESVTVAESLHARCSGENQDKSL